MHPCAPYSALARGDGVGEASINQIKLLAAAAHRVAKGEIRRKIALVVVERSVIEYCRAGMALADARAVPPAVSRQASNQLIADEVQQTGTVDHTPVYPREVIKRALELSATAPILVHNHPSGDPTPSQADIQMTKAIVDIATPLGISVHDHIIVGRNGHASLKGMRLI